MVVCTEHLGKELQREVGVGSMVTSGSLDCVMVDSKARDVGLIPTVGTIFPIFITSNAAVTMILYKLYDGWSLNLHCVCFT